MVWLSSRFLHTFCPLFLVFLCLRTASGQTMDEIIAGSSKEVTDFDFMADITGKFIRAELDMMLTLQQYQALYNSLQTSRSDASADLPRKKRKAILPATHRWTDKEIPYKIEKAVFSVKDIEEINNAIQEWQNYTCIRFRQAARTEPNFVNFEDGTGCSSYVGMNGGKHPIALASGCRQKGVIAHEIGHAVGFYHEQNRPDRDNYIIIKTENIIHPNLNNNFQKYPWSAVSTYNVSYDYTSIMHYGGRAFSGNGQYTIITRDPAFQEVIGNREGLSFNDIKLANLMYSCSEKCSPNVLCPGDGFMGKDCQCWCRGNPVQKCQGSENRATSQRPTVIPTTKLTVQPTSVACKDMNTNCLAWAKAGYCQTNNYVKTYCKDSCSLCRGGSTTATTCRDVREHCQYWKQQGYCHGGVYETFMTEKCPLSCGKCKISSTHSGSSSRNEIRVNVAEDNGISTVSSSLLVIITGIVGCLIKYI